MRLVIGLKCLVGIAVLLLLAIHAQAVVLDNMDNIAAQGWHSENAMGAVTPIEQNTNPFYVAEGTGSLKWTVNTTAADDYQEYHLVASNLGQMGDWSGYSKIRFRLFVTSPTGATSYAFHTHWLHNTSGGTPVKWNAPNTPGGDHWIDSTKYPMNRWNTVELEIGAADRNSDNWTYMTQARLALAFEQVARPLQNGHTYNIYFDSLELLEAPVDIPAILAHIGMDQGNWVAYPGNGEIDISGDRVHMRGLSGNSYLVTRDRFNNTYWTFETDIIPVDGENNGGEFNISYVAPNGPTYWLMQWGWEGKVAIFSSNPGWGVRYQSTQSLPRGQLYHFRFDNTSTGITIRITDAAGSTVFFSWAGHISGPPGCLMFGASTGGGLPGQGVLIDSVTLPMGQRDPVSSAEPLTIYPYTDELFKPVASVITETVQYREIAAQVSGLKTTLTGTDETGTVKASAGGLTIRESTNYFSLDGPETRLVVEKSTGIACRLTSKSPTSLDVLPPTRYGAMPYIWNKTSGWFSTFFSGGAAAISQGSDSGDAYLQLSVPLVPSNLADASAFRARATYRIFSDRAGINCSIWSDRSDTSEYELGVAQSSSSGSWSRQIYPGCTGDHTIVAPGTATTQQFQDEKNDSTLVGPYVPYTKVRYPYGVLDRSDRFFLWGCMDLNTFTVLRAGRFDWGPGFSVQPTRIEKMQSISFDYICKAFPKPDNNYTSLVQWYARHVYSTHPLTKGIVTMPSDLEPRCLSDGNFSFSMFAESGTPPQYYDAQVYRDFETRTKGVHGVHLWYAICNKWNDTYPTSGDWYTRYGYHVTAAGLKDDIKRLHDQGYKVYLYFRQLYPSNGVYTDKPPYDRWMYRNVDGKYYAFFNAWYAPKSRQQTEWGVSAAPFADIYANFQNAEFRKWYISELKHAIDYYQPDGIGWDMGWYDLAVGFCDSEPKTRSIAHGILRVQYEVWKWLKAKYPEKKIIQNTSTGGPTQLYCDAVMFESPVGDRIPDLDIQAAKAFKTTIIGLSYPDVYKGTYGAGWQSIHVQSLMRNLSLGCTWGGRGYDMWDKTGSPMLNDDLSGWIWAMKDGAHLNALTKFSEFSAKTGGTPLVTEASAVTTSPQSDLITASVWAKNGRLLAACYNAGGSQTVRVNLNPTILATYGWSPSGTPVTTVLDQTGQPTPASVSRPDSYSFELVIPQNSCLLIEWGN